MDQTDVALTWRDGAVPVSSRFNDPYYSLDDGLAEAQHVFLTGNDLPRRFEDGFHIAELGFGTGLNLLAAATAWRDAGIPGALLYTSFEQYPLSATEALKALSAFPTLEKMAAMCTPIWEIGALSLGWLEAKIILGDGRQTLPSWQGAADAWFLDRFSPARNPELWEDELLCEVAGHTAAQGTFATYTAAGALRRGLSAAGFDVARAQGYGRKRHMTRGRLT